MTEIPINQKEYLKKYLAMGKAPGEKRKKKKKTPTASRIQIIDDDVVTINTNTVLNDPIIIDEDAPQIVAIIDERPPSMRVDEKTKNPLWQPIGTVPDVNPSEHKQMIKSFKIEKPSEKTLVKNRSPPRRHKKDVHSPPGRERSPWRDVVIKEEIRSEVGSPPRRNDDNSPPRRNRRMVADFSPSRRDTHNSPPRRNRRVDSDFASSRRDDNSPPRKNRHKDNDSSPPRKRKESKDSSPPRKKQKDSYRREDNIDRSRSLSKYDNRRKDKREERARTPDHSPPRKNKNDETKKKKMEKTLDGKTAGLQNARELIEETNNFHSREDKLFKSLPKDVSGQNAETVHRERKTGRIRNLQEEEEFQRKKREEEEKKKEQYERWGRGLAQVESREKQLQDQLHEMSKPLARYADDEDLEKYLKEQEREGDPMLAYIRKKRRKKAAEAGEVIKPKFEGEFMPNRYGIRPGHRWDGVDRSNGYEKKWFEVQNEKKAMQEDTYKWSTEDM